MNGLTVYVEVEIVDWTSPNVNSSALVCNIEQNEMVQANRKWVSSRY